MIWGSIFCPGWLHFGTQVVTQEPLKTVPERPQDAPKTPPRQPKSHKSTQNQNLIDFSSDPGGYPIGRSDGVPPPALNFQSLWAHFGIIVGARFARRNFKKHLIKFRRSKGHSITLCCWRGGGVAALLRCWIRRASPGAWRTESDTLTNLLTFLFLRIYT